MKIENLTADLEFYRELKSRLEEALLEGLLSWKFLSREERSDIVVSTKCFGRSSSWSEKSSG